MKRFLDKQILIADDEISLREILAEELEEEGALVFQASNALDSLKILKTNAIDAIVSDIRMQGGDGISLLEGLKKIHYAHPPLLFMTGFSDLSVQDAYSKGAEGIILKPFTIEVFKTSVLQVLLPHKDRYQEQCSQNSLVLIEQTYASIETALELKKLRIARGGLFLEGHYASHVNDMIRFRIAFNSKSFVLLEGEGIIRWSNSRVFKNGPVGIGVEITYLTEESRRFFIPYLANLKEPSFIPREI
jgi:CheY-like chemotaxis protein